MDPVTIGAIGLLARWVQKANTTGDSGLLKRVLGPAADEVGLWLKGVTERRFANIQRIIESASVAGAIDGEPSMRVLGEIVEQGSWSDTELSGLYLGGVLAGASLDGPSNDAALPWARLINSLSSAELALHFIVYDSIGKQLSPNDVSIDSEHLLWNVVIKVPLSYWTSVTGDHEVELLHGSVLGLRRVGLLHTTYSLGGEEEPTLLVVSPTRAGVELFLRGHGLTGGVSAESIFNLDSNAFDNEYHKLISSVLDENAFGTMPIALATETARKNSQ